MKKLFTRLFSVTLLLLLITWNTAFSQTITSTSTGGLWSATTTWAGGVVPVAVNDVIIADGATVTIDQAAVAAATVASITVGQGISGMLLFDRTTGRALTVNGNVTVNAGGSFLSTDFTAITPTGDLTVSSLTIANVTSTAGIVAGMIVAGNNYQMTGATVASVTSNTIVLAAGAPTIAGTGVPLTIQLPAITQTLNIGGNLINNGTFDMSKATSTANSSTTVCNVTFNNITADQTISGTIPTLTRFQGVTLSKGSMNYKVISIIDTYVGGSGFTLTAGTWNQHAGNLINSNGTKTLASATGKLLIDGTGGYSNYAGSAYQLPVYTSGSLAVTGGTFEVNTTGKVQIGVGNNSITCLTPGVINLISGNIYVYGKITLTTGTATISGANVYTNPNPSATSGTYINSALLTSATPLSTGSNQFEVSGAGVFNFTSGNVTLVNPLTSPAAGRDLKITTTGTLNITNGIFYIGDGVSTTASSGSAVYNGFMNGSSLAIPNIVIQTGGITGRNLGLKSSLIVGKLTIISGAIEQVSGAGAVTYSTGGTLTYNGTAAQTSTGIELPAISGPTNLTVNNAAGVSLNAPVTINGALTFTSGSLSLGANNLTMASTGSILGASSSNYIITNGVGALTQSIGTASALSFPIGASTISYDPVTLTPATATAVAVNVGTTLPALAASNYTYNSKVWNITPVTPSSTVVTLTPSSAVATSVSDVIAQYTSGSYLNTSATKSGNAYTGTFSTFGPFVTGTTNLGTLIAQARISGVSFDGQIIHNDANLDLMVFDTNGRLMIRSSKNINMSSSTKGIYFVKSATGTLKIAL